jgi:D-methionine transport system ATP-binding protein
LLEIKNLHKKFGKLEVLNGVNISVEKGEKIVILGSSGSGKSTALRCVNLLERPTHGAVLIDDVDLTQLSEAELVKTRRQIGMIFQHFNLMAQKTAYENVAFALRHSKLSNEEKDKKIRGLLELVDLADRAENYPAQKAGASNKPESKR